MEYSERLRIRMHDEMGLAKTICYVDSRGKMQELSKKEYEEMKRKEEN